MEKLVIIPWNFVRIFVALFELSYSIVICFIFIRWDLLVSLCLYPIVFLRICKSFTRSWLLTCQELCVSIVFVIAFLVGNSLQVLAEVKTRTIFVSIWLTAVSSDRERMCLWLWRFLTVLAELSNLTWSRIAILFIVVGFCWWSAEKIVWGLRLVRVLRAVAAAVTLAAMIVLWGIHALIFFIFSMTIEMSITLYAIPLRRDLIPFFSFFLLLLIFPFYYLIIFPFPCQMVFESNDGLDLKL